MAFTLANESKTSYTASTEACSGYDYISKMMLFAKIVNDRKPLTIFAKGPF